jgi:hypothetical protein
MIKDFLLGAAGAGGKIQQVAAFSRGASVGDVHTITGCSFGAAEAGRVIVVCMAVTGVVSSVTIGGVSAANVGGAIFSATVPTGSSGSVVITYAPGGTVYVEGVVIRVADLSSGTPAFSDTSNYSGTLPIAQVSTYTLENVAQVIGTTYEVWVNGSPMTVTTVGGTSTISILNSMVSRVNNAAGTGLYIDGLVTAVRSSYRMILSSDINGLPFTVESAVSNPAFVHTNSTPSQSTNGAFGETPVRGIVRTPSVGVIIGCSHGSIGGMPRLSIAFNEVLGEATGMAAGRGVIPYSTTASLNNITWAGITEQTDNEIANGAVIAGFRNNTVAVFQ